MKTFAYIALFILSLGLSGCNFFQVDTDTDPIKFEDAFENTIYDYLTMDENKDKFSSFVELVDSSGIKNTLSAYNPNGSGYTLFLPDNDAIADFVSKSKQFSSFDEMLNNKEYIKELCAFHILNMKAETSGFPFGAFPEPNLSGDYLTVSFILEGDSSYYKINNSAIVVKTNIEESNGFIHQIGSVLEPVTFTTYNWLMNNPDYSIFKGAIDLTGLKPIVDVNLKADEQNNKLGRTLLVEPDSIYNQFNIYTLDDLIAYINPNNDDYTSQSNDLYGFVAYHILRGYYFIDDFVDVSTIYNTYSEIPLNINGNGLDVLINKGKQVFDTIVYESDTTFVDYIKFNYDNSNVLTQSGAIHIIDKVMTQQRPTRSAKSFEFNEEPSFNEYRNKAGEYTIEEDSLSTIKWSGGDLIFVKIDGWIGGLSNNDYLQIQGDFTLSYDIGKIIPGKYEVKLRAHSNSSSNAVVQVFIDNKQVGSNVDLTVSSSWQNFQTKDLGVFDFKSYSEQTVEIRPLIPGDFLWDAIIFEPI